MGSRTPSEDIGQKGLDINKIPTEGMPSVDKSPSPFEFEGKSLDISQKDLKSASIKDVKIVASPHGVSIVSPAPASPGKRKTVV